VHSNLPVAIFALAEREHVAQQQLLQFISQYPVSYSETSEEDYVKLIYLHHMHKQRRFKVALIYLLSKVIRPNIQIFKYLETTLKTQTKFRGLSPRANYTERPPPVGEVKANIC
jgi:hypothetical protein